jgi:O-antigen/teichoic acid export membrane protein
MSEVTTHRPLDPPAEQSADRFVTNVLWNWIGVAVQLLPGLVVTPYIIIKLGEARYGVWSLAFQFVAYYALLDLGLRSAAVRYAAHYRALGQFDKINELLNTLLLYFGAIGLLLIAITALVWQKVDLLFKISPQYHNEFSWLILLAGINVAAGAVGSLFSGCVEGFHRFDISNRIFIVTFGARSVGWFVLLASGHGLISMGVWTLFTNIALVLLYVWSLFHMFPRLRISARHASRAMFRETFSYGIHTFLAGMASRGLETIAPLLIGHYRNETEVGYYTFPLRLLQYGSDAVSRVGVVATPQSADLAARGQEERVAKLGIYANRYCLALFMPAAIFLMLYGYPLFAVWLRKPTFAAHTAPLLPAMLLGFTLAQTAQFCSASILFGLGKQLGYAVALLGELALTVAGTIWLLPRYGLFGVAAWCSILMLISRGGIAPWLLCRHLHYSFPRYMVAILARPLLVSVPFWVILILLKQAGATGKSVAELFVLGASTSILYLAACYYTCLAKEHQAFLTQWLRRKLGRYSAQSDS